MKCSWAKFKWEEVLKSGVKCRWVKFKWEEVFKSVVKWSEV